jgi:hypothetical protein
MKMMKRKSCEKRSVRSDCLSVGAELTSVESLEAELAQRNPTQPPQLPPIQQTLQEQQYQDQQSSHQLHQHQWSDPQSAFGAPNISAPSPTAFLELLSSTATEQASSSAFNSTIPGLKAGAAENAMMSTNWAATPSDAGLQGTGLTPFLSFTDNQEAQPASEFRPEIEHMDTNGSGSAQSMHTDSRRSSAGYGGNGHSSAGEVPRQSTFYSFSTNGDNCQSMTENLNWPPPVGEAGLQPSTRTDGPWRGIETVQSVYAPQPIEPSIPDISSQQNQAETGTADFNEAVQQQILLDLFWPGWPPLLPEPNIVNDL